MHVNPCHYLITHGSSMHQRNQPAVTPWRRWIHKSLRETRVDHLGDGFALCQRLRNSLAFLKRRRSASPRPGLWLNVLFSPEAQRTPGLITLDSFPSLLSFCYVVVSFVLCFPRFFSFLRSLFFNLEPKYFTPSSLSYLLFIFPSFPLYLFLLP